MTLGQWVRYYTNRLAAVTAQAEVRGADTPGPEHDEFARAIQHTAAEIVLKSGHRIVRDGSGWNVLLPDGTPHPNGLDGKSPYWFGWVGDAFYVTPCSDALDASAWLDDPLPVDALREPDLKEVRQVAKIMPSGGAK